MAEPEGGRGPMDEGRLHPLGRRLGARCIKRWEAARNQLAAATTRPGS